MVVESVNDVPLHGLPREGSPPHLPPLVAMPRKRNR
jgi:hypothetical protein